VQEFVLRSGLDDPGWVNPFVIAMALLPVIAWLLIARTQRFRWAIALVLIVWLAIVVGAVSVFPRARIELTLLYLPVAASVIWVARARESGLAERRWPMSFRALMTVLFGLSCCLGGITFDVRNEPLVLDADLLLPIPEGLNATDMRSGRPCVTTDCVLEFRVTGQRDQASDEIKELVWQHLIRKGWSPDRSACRPAGWLINRAQVCVSVTTRDDVVHVRFFEGAGA
jgi:hypothetical protein